MSFKKQPTGFAIKAIHGGQSPSQWSHGAIVPPIVTSTQFRLNDPDSVHDAGAFAYGRVANPTRLVLETCLAQLDGGRHALTYASGSGAVTAIVQLLRPGDHVVGVADMYGGTYGLFEELFRSQGVLMDLVDMTDLKAFAGAIKANTKMVWMESPTNPLLKVIDIAAVAKIIAEQNPNIMLAVDNTYLTPYLLRPLELGATVSMYSLSKYMNGHGDVIMGALVTNDEKLYKRLHHMQETAGIIPSPFDCAQVTRSLKTLVLRMEQHRRSGLAVAEFLDRHASVKRVAHPALPSHPQHELALRQQYGHSGIFSVWLQADGEQTRRFVQALKLVTLAASFGGAHSVIQMPSLMLYGPHTLEERAAMGITANMLRLSVGLEDTDAIIEDLEQALRQM